jgi:hypothetical protein
VALTVFSHWNLFIFQRVYCKTSLVPVEIFGVMRKYILETCIYIANITVEKCIGYRMIFWRSQYLQKVVVILALQRHDFKNGDGLNMSGKAIYERMKS